VHTVVNRCDPPGDGDILVPVRTVCVIGTTDVHTDSPDDLSIGRDEVQQMLDAGEVLVPGFRQARALHAWTGSRPLFSDERAGSGDDQDTRHMSRGLAVVDHLKRDGVAGLLTITGGKLTTYRLMAEQTLDRVTEFLRAKTRPCATATEPLLPDPASARYSGVLPPAVSPEAVDHFRRHEWALTPDDVMLRRTGWQHYLDDASQVESDVRRWMDEADVQPPPHAAAESRE
jgi:glycerol-3-phosphate dehydrogenase